MRLGRRRAEPPAAGEERALLAAARAGDGDALALLRAGLPGPLLARLREACGGADPVPVLRSDPPPAALQVLHEAGLGPRALAELRGDEAADGCRGAGLVALARSGRAHDGERAAAEAHVRACRECRALLAPRPVG